MINFLQMEKKRKQRVLAISNAQKGSFDKFAAEKSQAGIARLEKYHSFEEIELVCKLFHCNDVEALKKDDTYLTALLCRNIEKTIFEQRFNDLIEKKRAKK